MEQMKEKKRYKQLDLLRGITLISMILYHAVWDLVYIWEIKWSWFYTEAAYVWQQSICWMFIFLSGFCWSFGRRKGRRGFTVFAAGVVVSLVTLLAAPEQKIVFGVLTFLGSSMLLLIPLEKLFRRLPAEIGLPGSMAVFWILRDVNRGYLGGRTLHLMKLPESWYEGGYAMTFLGFTDKSFYSADYFSLLPWFFLFLTGYFCCRLAQERGVLRRMMEWQKPAKAVQPLLFMGQHSLIIYMLHQPAIYLVLRLAVQ